MCSCSRNCGNVFCKDCCHLKLPIPDQQLYDPVLVCNNCHDLLLESRTREIRSQQLKKAIATASSWGKRRVVWPTLALSCLFLDWWAECPVLTPTCCGFGFGGWGGGGAGGIVTLWVVWFLNGDHCKTVRGGEKKKIWDGGASAGEVFLQNKPSVFKDYFSLERCSVLLPPHSSVL